MLAPSMAANSAQLLTRPPRLTITAAVASAPMSTWPSAPIFQKRILKAGASAMPMSSSDARSRIAQEKRMDVENVPPIMTP